MDIEGILGIVAGIVLIIAVAIIVRRFWFAATNPDIAYELGRKVRRFNRNAGSAAIGAAHAAGRATGKVENAAGVVGRSFQDGRDSTKRSDSDPDSGA